MSKLSEILKLIPKGMSNPLDVINGWKNDVLLEHNNLSEEKTEIILERRAICENCTLNSQKAQTSEEYLALYGWNYETKLNYLHCSVCQCPVKKKTACLDCKCGLENYNIENPNNKQPLKW